MFQSAREKIISNHCGGSFRRAGNCPARFRQSRYGLSCAFFFILFLSIPSVIMAVPGHDKGRSVYREALSLTEHGQNAKALFLLNQLSDSLSMLHNGSSENPLVVAFSLPHYTPNGSKVKPLNDEFSRFFRVPVWISRLYHAYFTGK